MQQSPFRANIGALAIDPTNPNILYCGTGEADLSADSYPGVGLSLPVRTVYAIRA